MNEIDTATSILFKDKLNQLGFSGEFLNESGCMRYAEFHVMEDEDESSIPYSVLLEPQTRIECREQRIAWAQIFAIKSPESLSLHPLRSTAPHHLAHTYENCHERRHPSSHCLVQPRYLQHFP